MDEIEFKKYLYTSYFLRPIEILFDKLQVHSAPYRVATLEELRNRVLTSLPKNYTFNLQIPFEGSEKLFRLKPSSFILKETRKINVHPDKKAISILITVQEPNKTEFEQEKRIALEEAFANVENVNCDAAQWNQNLEELISESFQKMKSLYIAENNFFKDIRLNINQETTQIFSVPVVKEIEIPKPQPSFEKVTVLEPSLNDEIYQDILRILYSAGRSMEQKPSLYKNKDEESLRDLFVFLLETRYESTSATGETFNKRGKTDIILKHEDGTNLFVAECKFWRGVNKYLDAISQLFDNYLTWMDSKAAIIIFVQNIGLQNVIEIIKDKTPSHRYFRTYSGERGSTSFSFEFRLPQDDQKSVFLEVMCFHLF